MSNQNDYNIIVTERARTLLFKGRSTETIKKSGSNSIGKSQSSNEKMKLIS